MDMLEKLAAEGFTLRSLPSYPRHLCVEKHGCAALLEPTPDGRWKQFSAAGYLVDGQIALLVERGGRPVFAYKSKQISAEGEPLENFRRFEQELHAALEDQSAQSEPRL